MYICPTCCKNYIQSQNWHLRQQIFAFTTLIDRFTSDISIAYDSQAATASHRSCHQLIKFELLTQSITWIAPQSAAAPPVRMGLTKSFGGQIFA